MTWDDCLLTWLTALLPFTVHDQAYDPGEEEDEYENYYEREPVMTLDELTQAVGPQTDQEDQVKDLRVQKAMMLLIKKKLQQDFKYNHEFQAQTDWKWLNQLLATARLQELASVHIVKKGRKGGVGFDIVELVHSYYGYQILQSLNFSERRRTINEAEFATVKAACAKIKLTLPEIIQPTTTEQYFNPIK